MKNIVLMVAFLFATSSIMGIASLKSNVLTFEEQERTIFEICDELATQFGQEYDLSYSEENAWFNKCMDANEGYPNNQ